ncbi:TolC family protein [Paraflavitalea soli]|uniref:TolC family protein n=1 Tax=Paraflavitalea soli TaxID=2315862 RepID=A0A3B7N7D8_9BACT|nr:TolC family protein [Paraflavitalea soli]AXY77871.1 TolC family protein [Paraflavitalea soli]
MSNQYRERLSEKKKILKACLLALAMPLLLPAQQQSSDSVLQQATLENVIQYAIRRQPLIQQSLIDEETTETTIKSKLADWFPQLNFNYLFQHNFEVQTAVIGGEARKLGVNNTSALQFGLTQNLFNRDALLASRSARDVRNLAKQNTSSTKIDVAVNVAKAFYDVLATEQQIKVSHEDITRLERSLKDATAQYTAGVADKTDYKRATIALNNARALLKTHEELVIAKREYLKSLMGYPTSQPIDIIYDSLQMEREITLDTTQTADYKGRIEFRLLETQRKLQQANVRYNKWSYLPNVYASGAYNFNFQNDKFSKLYNTNYPNSYAALTLSMPIFQGGKRKYNIQQAEWELKSLDWQEISLKNSVNSQYAQALAVYKSSLATYLALKENMDLAREVYDVINLQYRSGVKTYLEVINAESDLRTARINYYNALYVLLSGKIDVLKALGQINY